MFKRSSTDRNKFYICWFGRRYIFTYCIKLRGPRKRFELNYEGWYNPNLKTVLK